VGILGDISGPAIGVSVGVLVYRIDSRQGCLVEVYKPIRSFRNYDSTCELAAGGRLGDLIVRMKSGSER